MATQLVFLGAPGSGKGTQAKKLVSEKGFKHVSTGDLLRAEIAKGSELGQKVDGILKAGQLVDNDTVLELLKANCDLASSEYIFDGYPRNLDQAKSLDEKILGDSSKKAVYFEVNVDNLVDRLTNRRTCKSCGEIFNMKTLPPKVEGVCDKCGGELQHRADDQEETIRKRMDVFTGEIQPMLDYYKGQGVLVTLDASSGIDAVYDGIISAL